MRGAKASQCWPNPPTLPTTFEEFIFLVPKPAALHRQGSQQRKWMSVIYIKPEWTQPAYTSLNTLEDKADKCSLY